MSFARRRLLSLVSAAVVANGLVAAWTLGTAPSGGASPLSAYALNQPYEAQDYATTTFHDAWDFSNAADLLTDAGPTAGISAPSMANGTFSYTVTGGSYISPLWTGYPGSLRIGRDGAVPANRIPAASYTHARIHAYASASTSAALFWFTQDGLHGLGGHSMGLQPGWHEYDVPLVNNFPNALAWSGSIFGLRFATNAHTTTRISLDLIRLYKPTSASMLSWHSDAASAVLYWSTSGTPTTTGDTATSGQVYGATAILGVGDATADVGGYPPGASLYARVNGLSWVPLTTIVPRPNVIVDTPGPSGCGDFAVDALGHAWSFASGRDIAALRDVTNVSYSGGYLSATNSGPIRNDPWMAMNIARGIDGRKYHYLTLDTGYDGRFNLTDTVGGGTMGRITWKVAGQTLPSQTNDIVTYSGRRTVTIDLAMSTSALVEPDNPAHYAFAQAARVTLFRWDPNEDRGARRWHVYRMTLGKDCTARSWFTIKWHDAGFVPGARTDIYAMGGGHTYKLGSFNEVAGANAAAVNAAFIPNGRYAIRVYTSNSKGSAFGQSVSPLVVSH